MTKRSLFLICGLLLCLLLSGCGAAEKAAPEQGEPVTQREQPTQNEPHTAAEPDTADVSDGGGQAPAPDETPSESVPFPETVLFTYENVKITATGYEQGTPNAAHFTVRIENPDGLKLYASEVYVNNIAQKSDDTTVNEKGGYVSVLLNPFLAMGMNFGDMSTYELRFAARDQNGEAHQGELVKIEIPGTSSREPADPGALLFEEHGVALYAHLKTGDSFWGTCVYFYCVNHSGRTVRIGATAGPTYNGGSTGVEAGSVTSGDICDGRGSCFLTNLYDDRLEEAKIYPVSSVSWPLTVYDAEAECAWFAPGAVTIAAD